MNYSLLNEQPDLNPRLLQYLKAVEYHNLHNIKPPISLEKQFQITKSDRYIINKHIKQKKLKKHIGPKPIIKKKKSKNKFIGPCKSDNSMMKYKVEIDDFNKNTPNATTKCHNNSCSMYSSVKDFDRSLLGQPNNKLNTISDTVFSSYRDSHPYMYSNDIISRKSPYTTNTKTVNRLIINNKNSVNTNKWNKEQIQYLTTPLNNVDVESSMWHAEPSRIAGHNDLGGVSINRFEDLFVNVQEKSIYPFNFPRGGSSSRDPELYENQPAKII